MIIVKSMLEKVQTVISQSDFKKYNPYYKKGSVEIMSEFYSKHPQLFRSYTNVYKTKLHSNRNHFKTDQRHLQFFLKTKFNTYLIYQNIYTLQGITRKYINILLLAAQSHFSNPLLFS